LYYARGVVRALLIVIALGGAAAADGHTQQPREPKQHYDDLVDVAGVIDDAVIDMRYATADNFTGKELYPPNGGISTHPIPPNIRCRTNRSRSGGILSP
jgi:D-alanyl-D-alanine dipeptidase